VTIPSLTVVHPCTTDNKIVRQRMTIFVTMATAVGRGQTD